MHAHINLLTRHDGKPKPYRRSRVQFAFFPTSGVEDRPLGGFPIALASFLIIYCPAAIAVVVIVIVIIVVAGIIPGLTIVVAA